MSLRTIVAFFIFSALAMSASAQNKISGTLHCTKPDPAYNVDVGDRPHHSLGLSKVSCTWTKPLEIAGTESKEGMSISSDDITGNTSHSRGYHVTTMANGDKIYVRYQGSAALKDGAPQTDEGTWSFTGGTGKVKGIKGKGTHKGKAEGDSMTYEIEGEYELPK